MSKRNIQKNIKKNKQKKKEEYPEKKELITLSKIIFSILIIAILATMLFYIINKNYTLKNNTTDINYDEIMAGQTFNKNDNEYYVLFYEFDSDEDLSDKITDKKSAIYQVNLLNNFNKSVLSETSNKEASKAEELKITGPTIIKIESGKNVEYIEGYDNIVKYLEGVN